MVESTWKEQRYADERCASSHVSLTEAAISARLAHKLISERDQATDIQWYRLRVHLRHVYLVIGILAYAFACYTRRTTHTSQRPLNS